LQARSQATVDVLVEATERELARVGYRKATTNRIAEVAGVSVGTLYHFFPTKEALIEAVVHRMWMRELAAVQDELPLLATAPLDQALRAILRAFVGVVAQRVDLYRHWYGEASHLGQYTVGSEMTERVVDVLEASLRARADVRPKEDLRFSLRLAVLTATYLARMGTIEFPDAVRSGKLEAELADMIARYLSEPRGA
jgi:AcrR family transcriptional regulator